MGKFAHCKITLVPAPLAGDGLARSNSDNDQNPSI